MTNENFGEFSLPNKRMYNLQAIEPPISTLIHVAHFKQNGVCCFFCFVLYFFLAHLCFAETKTICYIRILANRITDFFSISLASFLRFL